eukprot:3938966-Rhodomonas_salina.3
MMRCASKATARLSVVELSWVKDVGHGPEHCEGCEQPCFSKHLGGRRRWRRGSRLTRSHPSNAQHR